MRSLLHNRLFTFYSAGWFRNKWVPLFRKLFHRKGHGIHSPFVFDLITNVIEETLPYYGYKEIDSVRLRLQGSDQSASSRGKQHPILKILRKQGISKKEGELLFRLANHYKPRNILTIGSAMGLAPLYLTGYASRLNCISLESEEEIAAIAQKNSEKKTKKNIRTYKGNYEHTLPQALRQFKQIDCIYFAKELAIETIDTVYRRCIPFIHDETLLIISGIHDSSGKRNYWKQLCKDTKITISVDLYKLGLIFFRPKLHKRTYKSRML